MKAQERFLSDLTHIFCSNEFSQNKSTHYYCNGKNFSMYSENLVPQKAASPFPDVNHKFTQSDLPWLAPGSLSAHGMQLGFSKL